MTSVVEEVAKIKMEVVTKIKREVVEEEQVKLKEGEMAPNPQMVAAHIFHNLKVNMFM